LQLDGARHNHGLQAANDASAILRDNSRPRRFELTADRGRPSLIKQPVRSGNLLAARQREQGERAHACAGNADKMKGH